MMKYLFLISALIISCVDSTPNKKIVTNFGNTQGTNYSIKYLSPNGINYQNDIDSIFKAVDLSLSTYINESIISKINRNENVIIDSIFTRVFNMSLKIAHETNGSFDPTIAPLVNFWGFGFEEISNKNENILVNLMHSVGYKKISIKDGYIIKENSNTQIDFNAIAQGFTVDLIGEYLQKIGLTNYMIEIGGELKCSGLNADEKPWRIGIDKPSEEIQKERHLAIIEVSNKSVASSGNYRKLKIDQETGIKYAHTINPKTGMPTITDLLSVTIVSESCMQADAIATACMVMGKEKSINYIISKPQIDALLIYSGPKGEWIKYQTEGFKKMRIY
jgi:FAD:protein FMN transferase